MKKLLKNWRFWMDMLAIICMIPLSINLWQCNLNIPSKVALQLAVIALAMDWVLDAIKIYIRILQGELLELEKEL
jgi:hypothetical protein